MELRRLLAATRRNERSLRGLTGLDRFHLYATACGTGFRASALASLTLDSFDLDVDTPTVTLAARHAKNKKQKVQPIPPDLAELLRAYLHDKPAGVPVWPGSWSDAAAEMLRIDLDAAGIPYAIEGPDGPLYADFHAFRHSYLTLGGRAGIDLRTLQELAGHSTPVLTARYSHRRLYDLAGAVEKLPSFLPTSDDETAEPTRLAATGTDGESFGCTLVAHVVGNQGHSRDICRQRRGGRSTGSETTQPAELSAGCIDCHLQSSNYPARIRTWTKRTKISCATVTLPGKFCGFLPHPSYIYRFASIFL